MLSKQNFFENSWVVSLIVILAGLICLHYLLFSVQKAKGDEINLILKTGDLKQQIKLYRGLINRVGPAEAQDMLLHSGLPFTGQTHLLNHTVGEAIYDKYGLKGLYLCKDYFLESCYHGFILKAFEIEGFGVKDQIIEACQSHGTSVLAQCSHALGHGFLAWVGYTKLPQADRKSTRLNSS